MRSITPFVQQALELDSTEIPARVALCLAKVEAVELETNPQKFFEWSSGIMSPIYCDTRITYSFIKERAIILSSFLKKIEELGLTKDGVPTRRFVIAGIVTGAIGWATVLGHELDVPVIYVRPKPKEHGKGNQIEGYLSEGVEVLFIEDLFSTGGSSTKAIQAVMNAGGNVHHCISIFTYGFSVVAEKFAALPQNCRHHSLSATVTIGLSSDLILE